MEIVTFGYSLGELNINSSAGVLFDYYSSHGEWTVLSSSWESSDQVDYTLSYGKITYTLVLERHPGAHWLAILIPIILNSFLVPLVFLLPPSAGEKMGYSLTVLLAFVVMLTLVTDSMPTSSKNTSLLEVYIIVVLFMSCISVLLTIYSVMWFNKPQDSQGEEPHAHLQTLAKLMKSVVMVTARCKQSNSVDSISHTHQGDKEDMEKDGQMDDENGENMSYPEIQEVLDAFLLRFYMLFLVVFTTIMFLMLRIGPQMSDAQGTPVHQ